MRVVWQRQETASSNSHVRLTAVLEIDGSARQSSAVSELGSIEERFLQTRIRCTREFHQGLFWKTVDRQLDILGLEKPLRENLEKEISRTVPRPGEEWALWGVTCIPRFEAP